jgi:hypothetical protein
VIYVLSPGQRRAAVVTDVIGDAPGAPERINLVWFGTAGEAVVTFAGSVPRDQDTRLPGTWHFEERGQREG